MFANSKPQGPSRREALVGIAALCLGCRPQPVSPAPGAVEAENERREFLEFGDRLREPTELIQAVVTGYKEKGASWLHSNGEQVFNAGLAAQSLAGSIDEALKLPTFGQYKSELSSTREMLLAFAAYTSIEKEWTAEHAKATTELLGKLQGLKEICELKGRAEEP